MPCEQASTEMIEESLTLFNVIISMCIALGFCQRIEWRARSPPLVQARRAPTVRLHKLTSVHVGRKERQAASLIPLQNSMQFRGIEAI